VTDTHGNIALVLEKPFFLKKRGIEGPVFYGAKGGVRVHQTTYEVAWEEMEEEVSLERNSNM